ncbi:uncharacterized protein LOC142340145 [Convolutriloba macropyga]|uniref:uncharacterized protein LOC142340145 n=1 Tax=Convolutriloba macropyga TaxID=536237 RepID=UPI003F522344
MVQINIWFTPRSRSTALVRCLSNIPDSKVFFENFLWAFYLGDEDSMYTKYRDQMGAQADSHVVPGYNTNSAIKQWTENTAKVKILKDFIFALNDRYEEVIEKDAVNIFLVRDPEYVFTSFLPTAKTYFYHISKRTHKDVTVFYGAILKGIQTVSKICTKPPIIIDGAQLSTKEGSINVVKAICERAGIEFTESLLTWKAIEGLDPNWVSPGPATTVNLMQGFFARANTSTCFEDSKERAVDLEALAKENAGMVEDIKACKPYYNQILSLPFVLKLD